MAQVTLERLALDREAAACFVPEAFRALWGRLRQFGGGRLDSILVQGYFDSRRVSQEPDIIAGESSAYAPLMQRGTEHLLNGATSQSVRLLDYGCGSGALLRRISVDARSANVQYTGYDISSRQLGQCLSQTEHLSSCFESVSFRNSKPTDQFDSIALVNVLCYHNTDELEETLEWIAAHLTSSGAITIVEPFPAWYWEQHFAGLRLAFRYPKVVVQLLERAGLELVHAVEAYAIRTPLGYHMPIAWSLHLKLRMEREGKHQ